MKHIVKPSTWEDECADQELEHWHGGLPDELWGRYSAQTGINVYPKGKDTYFRVEMPNLDHVELRVQVARHSFRCLFFQWVSLSKLIGQICFTLLAV